MVKLPSILIETLRKQEVTDQFGNTAPLDSNVSESEAASLYEAISITAPIASVEIGLAHGVSAMAIIGAIAQIKAGHHHIIDPHQRRYGYTGKTVLERAGYAPYFTLYEKIAAEVLPGLGPIQFALIDSSHLFDLTIEEFVLIDRKLLVGGIVAFHDLWMPSIRSVIRYILNNRAYEVWRGYTPKATSTSARQNIAKWMAWVLSRVPNGSRLFAPSLMQPIDYESLGNLVFLRKLANDIRDWRYHKPF
jgi:predicted O-methyltransferase YrrM